MSALSENPALVEAVGSSDVFHQFQENLSRAAKVDRPVLLIGERGTGKELAAARLHYLSRRWQGPMVTLNCASLAENLLETELFGHEAGAFTGAVSRRAGRFEQADGGTLFLDEIGTMPMRVQETILRVVEYGTYERVGGSRPMFSDVRLVAATNADLPSLANAGKFKRDLLDRLSFEVLTLPPLRARGEDILLLAQRFAAAMAVETGLSDMPEFTPEAERELLRYTWPGNVRELKNTVERAVFRCGARIDTIDFDPFSSPWRPAPEPDVAAPPSAVGDSLPKANAGVPHRPAPPSSFTPPRQGGAGLEVQQDASLEIPLKEAAEDLERRYLLTALDRAKFNQSKAADILGLSYHQFRGLYRKHKHAIETG